MNAKVCIVVDCPVKDDERVKWSKNNYEKPKIINIFEKNGKIEVFSKSKEVLILLKSIFIFIKAIIISLKYLKPVLYYFKEYKIRKGFTGLKAVFRNLRAAMASAEKLGDYSIIHANDLYCAVAGLKAAQNILIYDSHEVQFHRNRKTGWLRILAEVGLERMILERADSVWVVNNQIALMMRDIYRTDMNLRIVYNDFYQHLNIKIPQPSLSPVIVYVGRGMKGRMLAKLEEVSQENDTSVVIYSIGAPLANSCPPANWLIGPYDYKSHLEIMVRSRRCLMWCCHENVCLSYFHALPNKFFQAIAMGIPIIANKGTYLAEIVIEHNLGCVFDGENFSSICSLALSHRFEYWCKNIASFRLHVRDGSIIL